MTKTKFLQILLIALFLAVNFSNDLSAAEVTINCRVPEKEISLSPSFSLTQWESLKNQCNAQDEEFSLSINGEIDVNLEKTIKQFHDIVLSDSDFKNKLNQSSDPKFWVFLFSQGGDVNNAMNIGRYIREIRALTWAAKECLSSCVFLLSAGVERLATGKVGVHRPYLSKLSPNAQPRDIEKNYAQRRQAIIAYFSEMHIPSSLFDFMDQIPPESIHILNDQELRQYQLSESKDPVYDELYTAKRAAFYNITSEEYRSRTTNGEATCGSFDSRCGSLVEETMVKQCFAKLSLCNKAILWGLSINEYKKRNQKADVECKALSQEESLKCFRAIMLGR